MKALHFVPTFKGYQKNNSINTHGSIYLYPNSMYYTLCPIIL